MPSAFGPSGRARYGKRVTLHPSTERTATGNGTAFRCRDYVAARLRLNITASDGTTPTLDVQVQTSADNSTWTEIDAFAQATGTGAQNLVVNGLDNFVRVRYVIGGTTPEFTFTVTGDFL